MAKSSSYKSMGKLKGTRSSSIERENMGKTVKKKAMCN